MRDHRSALRAPQRLKDPLLQGLVGDRRVAYRMRGDWMLDRQFLRLSMKHAMYRVTIHIGHDHVENRLVAHWLDTMGGRASATLGVGQSVGAALQFIFAQPGGPSHATCTLDPRQRPRSLLVLDYDADNVAPEVAHFTISSLKRQPRAVLRWFTVADRLPGISA